MVSTIRPHRMLRFCFQRTLLVNCDLLRMMMYTWIHPVHLSLSEGSVDGAPLLNEPACLGAYATPTLIV